MGAVDSRSPCSGRILWLGGGIPGGAQYNVDIGSGLGAGFRGNLRRAPTPWPRRATAESSAGCSPSAPGVCSFPSHRRSGLPAFLLRSGALYSSRHWVWPMLFSPVSSSASVLEPSWSCEPWPCVCVGWKSREWSALLGKNVFLRGPSPCPPAHLREERRAERSPHAGAPAMAGTPFPRGDGAVRAAAGGHHDWVKRV